MQGGYFGKLPAKADFVSGHCPAGFLRLWEPFLMQGLAGSRKDLSPSWEEAYMTMPVWRFLLNPEDPACSLPAPLAGAFMPSVDRVGREFPLTIVAKLDSALADGGPCKTWYDGVEAILLKTLEDDAGLPAFQEAVCALDEPDAGVASDRPAKFEMLVAAENESQWLSSSFWCRAGERTFSFRCEGLPSKEDFRWLILPERYGRERPENRAGETATGRNHPEDHRT